MKKSKIKNQSLSSTTIGDDNVKFKIINSFYILNCLFPFCLPAKLSLAMRAGYLHFELNYGH